MKYIHPFYIGIPNIILFILAFILIKPFSSNLILKIIGMILILSVFLIEKISHKVHKQAHTNAKQINKLVTTGIYAKIRHPIYLGWTFLNIGAILFIQNLASIFIAIIFITLWYLEAKQEEKFIEGKFPKQYKKYKKQTGMFFPKI